MAHRPLVSVLLDHADAIRRYFPCEECQPRGRDPPWSYCVCRDQKDTQIDRQEPANRPRLSRIGAGRASAFAAGLFGHSWHQPMVWPC